MKKETHFYHAVKHAIDLKEKIAYKTLSWEEKEELTLQMAKICGITEATALRVFHKKICI